MKGGAMILFFMSYFVDQLEKHMFDLPIQSDVKIWKKNKK